MGLHAINEHQYINVRRRGHSDVCILGGIAMSHAGIFGTPRRARSDPHARALYTSPVRDIIRGGRFSRTPVNAVSGMGVPLGLLSVR